MGRAKKGSKAPPTSRSVRNNRSTGRQLFRTHQAIVLSTGDILDAARDLRELPVTLGDNITFHRGGKLSKAILDKIIDITRDNMKSSYDAALGWDNWDDHVKRDEMTHKNSRFLLEWKNSTLPHSPDDLVAFVHFRFERADDDDQESVATPFSALNRLVQVLYVYEIQVVPSHQRQGVGRQLMQLVESIAVQLGIDKIMLTCLKNRPEGLAFYKSKLHYELHRSSPEICGQPSPAYEILHKDMRK